MPYLLPPGAGESILGDAINADDDFGPTTDTLLQETGRAKIKDINDATHIVSSLTLALGIVFLVTTAILYGYYYSTTFDFTGLAVARSFSTNRAGLPANTSAEDSPYSFLSILDDLESAFAKWGIPPTPEEEGCRRKMVCEALLVKSRSNPSNKDVAESISHLLNRAIAVQDSWKGGETEERRRITEFMKAAKSGLKDDSCKNYSTFCPKLTLRTLTVLPK